MKVSAHGRCDARQIRRTADQAHGRSGASRIKTDKKQPRTKNNSQAKKTRSNLEVGVADQKLREDVVGIGEGHNARMFRGIYSDTRFVGPETRTGRVQVGIAIAHVFTEGPVVGDELAQQEDSTNNNAALT